MGANGFRLMFDHNYILDENNNPVLEKDFNVYCVWFENCDRHVGREQINEEVLVSTVFLGMDHRFDKDEGDPILFETMIFGGEEDQSCQRYCTWNEALEGHNEWVQKLKRSYKKYLEKKEEKKLSRWDYMDLSED